MGTNDKTNWLRRLAGEKDVKTHDGDPDYGYYRIRQKLLRTWWPIAFWYDKEGKLKCRYNLQMVEDERARELWHGASEHAITREIFDQVEASIKATGRPVWPGENDVVTRAYLAPDDNSLEHLQRSIAELEAEANTMLAAGPAKDQDECDQVADVADYLAALHKRADAARAAEKAPHWQACQDVDNKWRPLIVAAKIYERVKQLGAPFLKAKAADKQRREDEARAEAAAKLRAAQEAEQAAQEAIQAALESENEAAEATGSNSAPFRAEIAEEAQRKAEAAIREANEAKQAADDVAMERITAGSRGKSSLHLRTAPIVAIDDYTKARAFVIDDDPVEFFIKAHINRLAKAGATIPGVTVTKDQKAA